MRTRLLLTAALFLATSAPLLAQDDPTAAPAETPEPTVTHEVLQKGEGRVVGEGVAAVVHYVGTLKDGKKFDSSRDRDDPFVFEVGAGNVIKGWDQTVAKMRVGDRWKCVIPWQLAYGERGAGEAIPAKSDLIFDIEVLDVAEPTIDVVKEGTVALEAGDFVEVHVTASVVGGNVWNDTRVGEPKLMQIGGRSGIAGFDMAFKKMKDGAHWKITIPSLLALGKRGAPPKIPPNADHLFDVEIVRVLRPEIEVVKAGEGELPTRGQRVKVHYTGTLTDGTQFDSSREKGTPFEFTLGAGQVIPGWDLTVAKMRLGERVKVTIPWQLAYGARGRAPIPPKADLIFDIELLGIE